MTSCLNQGISGIIFMIIHWTEVLGQLIHTHKLIVHKVRVLKHSFCESVTAGGDFSSVWGTQQKTHMQGGKGFEV